MWILSFPISWLSDYALKKGMSRGTVRKVCNSVAHWGPAVALACMSIVPTDNTWAVVILTVAVGLNAGSLCGYQINHIDLSPNFAGTMMSITNCFATITAIIAPLICSLIVTDEVIIRCALKICANSKFCRAYKYALSVLKLSKCNTHFRLKNHSIIYKLIYTLKKIQNIFFI